MAAVTWREARSSPGRRAHFPIDRPLLVEIAKAAEGTQYVRLWVDDEERESEHKLQRGAEGDVRKRSVNAVRLSRTLV